jgi:CRP-like cAMP-binding protein
MSAQESTPQAGFALLNELADSEIAWLRSEGEIRTCEQGTVLVQEGSRIETLFVVLSGVISVTIGGGAAQEIARLGPGQIIGEMSFLEERPASASVRALEVSQVLALPRAKIDAKLRQDAAFGAHLYRGLAIVTSRRLRNVVGELERWLGTEPVAETEALTRWEEVARRTQEFKAKVVAAGKLDEADLDGSELKEPLRDFSIALDAAIGPDSPETIDAREELGARVQRELLPYFLKARTPAHLHQKPRGYPADFRATELVQMKKPDGEAPLGPVLDAAFLSLPSMSAWRGSRVLFQEELRRAAEEAGDRTLRITAVGAAPASELRGLAAARGAGVEATFIEFDEEALNSLRAALRGSKARLELESLVNIALGFRRVTVEGQDFVYSMLASSFSDRFAIGLLNYLHGLLRPGGWACVGFMHPSNPDKTFLSHMLGWGIAHRDQDDMNSLFRHSAFGSACERFEAEKHGIFHVAACQKA